MDNSMQESVLLSKGVNLKEVLLPTGTEFQIDMDFKSADKADPLLCLGDDDNMLIDDGSDDSDLEEGLNNIEQSADRLLLCSPEYHSFDDLAAAMTDVVPSGDVKILIIEEGTGALVPTDAYVTLHYAAYWEREKTAFDTTLTSNYGAPMKCRLGCGKFLPGLELGLMTVRGPKARFQLLLTPVASWGSLGVMPRIKNQRSLFCVTLIDVQDIGAVERFNDLPSEEQKRHEITLKTVAASNACAKDYFAKQAYRKALHHYHKSLSVLQNSKSLSETELTEIKHQMSKVYINLAICYAKLNLPKKVLLMCDDLGRVTNIENHPKGLYYYGKAFTMLGDYSEAQKFYKKALRLEPKNPDIGKEMVNLENILSVAAKHEKAMWKNVFNSKDLSDKMDDLNIDEDFKSSLKETCDVLASKNEVIKFALPNSLTKDEVKYVRGLVAGYEKLVFVEEVMGNVTKLAIVKKM